MEKGSSATHYAAYSITIPSLDALTIATAAKAVTDTAGPKLAPITISKNLFDPADVDVQPGFTLHLDSSGTLSASSAYTTSGFIPVVGGQAYTMSPAARCSPRRRRTGQGATTPNRLTDQQPWILGASSNTANYTAVSRWRRGRAPPVTLHPG